MKTIDSDAARADHVLLIDDDATIHKLVAAMLRTLDVRISCVTSGEAALVLARSDAPDLILLDNHMPTGSGLDVLRELKRDPTLAPIPVIMETGSDSNATLAACFASGAVDYIRKPFTSIELRARVGSVLERQRMLSELTDAAHLDRLTGLANRALLTERLSLAIERARKETDAGFTLLFLDFDRFKLVNDTLGHDVGDLLLKAIAGRLRSNLRTTDSSAREAKGNTVARLGGDEFVVVLAGVHSVDVANAVTDRLLEALALPYQLGRHSVSSSASIGAVLSSPEYLTADDMLRDADIAMYEAKVRGKARQVLFSTEMRTAVRVRVETENELRAAIGTDQLSLDYQPIISLTDRRICGVEALARWNHPTRGNIPPEEFIRIAEESNLILPLSDFVLRTACSAFMQWQKLDTPNKIQYVSVNLSRVQLSDPSLVDSVLRVLDDVGMRAPQLQLEVTESQVMPNRTLALRMLHELRSHGIRLAMDDFGTGHSSLSCLQELPLDVLKVDRSFVSNVHRARDFSAVLHAVITLADNLGLEVVAEGLEVPEQLVMLQALGCGFGQGYLLARPMTDDAIARLLSAPVGEDEVWEQSRRRRVISPFIARPRLAS